VIVGAVPPDWPTFNEMVTSSPADRPAGIGTTLEERVPAASAVPDARNAIAIS
jgi:hypothetical protein